MTAITTSVKRLLLTDLQIFLKHNVLDGVYLKTKKATGFNLNFWKSSECFHPSEIN